MYLVGEAINSLGWQIPPYSGGFLSWPRWFVDDLTNLLSWLDYWKGQYKPKEP